MTEKRWSEVSGDAGVLLRKNPVACGVHCPMHTVLSVVRGVSGVSTLVVGMPECCFYSRFVIDNTHLPDRHYTYVLDGSEVVFGCADGIMSALRTMKEDGAENVLIVGTCVPALIGQDLAQVSEDAADACGLSTAFIDLAHFKRNGWMNGFSLTMRVLAAFMRPQPPARQVNLLGECAGDEAETLRDMLEGAGWHGVAFSPHRAGAWRALSASRVSLVFSSVCLPLARALEQRFKIPLIPFFAAADFRQTEDCYSELATRLGIGLPDPPSPVLRTFRPDRFVCNVSHEDIPALADILARQGVVPEALHIEEIPKEKTALSADPLLFFDPETAQHGPSRLELASGGQIDGRRIASELNKIGYERIVGLKRLILQAQEGM